MELEKCWHCYGTNKQNLIRFMGIKDTFQYCLKCQQTIYPFKKNKNLKCCHKSSIISVHKFYFSLKPRLTMKFTASSCGHKLVVISWVTLCFPWARAEQQSKLSTALELAASSCSLAGSCASCSPSCLCPSPTPALASTSGSSTATLHFETSSRFFHSQLRDILLLHHAPQCTAWDSLFNIT